MDKAKEAQHTKRSQKDYSMFFKLQVVWEVERGELSQLAATCKYGIQDRSTVLEWLRKYGNFDWENQTPSNMPKTQEHHILKLSKKLNY